MSEKDFYRDTYNAKLSAKERLLLADIYQTGVAWEAPRVAKHLGLYEEDPARVRTAVSKIRRKLKGTGWTIPVNKGGVHLFGSYEVARG